MFKAIDRFIDSTTMYRLLLYYLIGLLLSALVLGQTHRLIYSPQNILSLSLVLLTACWLFNKLFAVIFKAPTNYESSLITALIMALIISPVGGGETTRFALAASGLAMASKYLLTIKNKHLFNPAAIAVTLTALGPQQSASWWVGAKVMLPFVIIGGVLLVRKLRHWPMVLTFLASGVAASLAYTLINHGSLMTDLKQVLFSSSLFFLGFVMLTEPLTSPTTRRHQIWYGLLVGVLFPPQVHLLSLYSTPERALVVGNIFAYLVSPKTRLLPVFKKAVVIGPSALDLMFEPGQPFSFQPGQYMEFTLPHQHVDVRGNRRYFTLASSPTEPELHLGIKFAKNGSSFKNAMLALKPSSTIAAGQIAGDFVLPDDSSQKLAFIAGGIGVTPFRSMVKYLVDSGEQRDVVMLYSARNADDLAYRDVFEEARQKSGIKTIYTVTDDTAKPLADNCHTGYVNSEMIKHEIPDYQDRTFYISGTHGMVNAMHATLTDMGVRSAHIKTDFFPGYA